MPKRPTTSVLIKKETSDLLSPPTTPAPVTPSKTKSKLQSTPKPKSTSNYTPIGTPTPTAESHTPHQPDPNATDPSLALKKERSKDDLNLPSPSPGKKRKITGTAGIPTTPGKTGKTGGAWGEGKKSKLARFIVEHGIKSMGTEDYEMIALEIGMNPSQVKDQTKPNRSNARSALLNLCETL